MDGPNTHSFQPSPVLDNLDIDLVVKVLAHTAFSPFFAFFIPVFYLSQGAKYTDPVIIYSSVYYAVVSLFWLLSWAGRLYENQGSFFFSPPRFDWGEQIVVITGGASGVGELLANTLAVRNVSVVVLDVKPIVTENYNISYYQCDVSKWEEVEAVSKRVIEEIGEPTVLINNAGVVQGKLIVDLKPEDVKQTFGVNTLAHFWTLKAFLPSMIKKKSGHIVTVSSVVGYSGVVQMSDYSASKAAINSLHESLRYELDIRHKCPQIRTTLLAPGHIFTPMFRTLRFPDSSLWKFFFPSLQPITVVKRIIAALDEQHSQVIMIPFFTIAAPWLPVIPRFLRDFCTWIAQANYAMTDFVKISGKRPDEDSGLTKSG